MLVLALFVCISLAVVKQGWAANYSHALFFFQLHYISYPSLVLIVIRLITKISRNSKKIIKLSMTQSFLIFMLIFSIIIRSWFCCFTNHKSNNFSFFILLLLSSITFPIFFSFPLLFFRLFLFPFYDTLVFLCASQVKELFYLEFYIWHFWRSSVLFLGLELYY